MKFVLALAATLSVSTAVMAQDHSNHGTHASHPPAKPPANLVEGVGVVRASDAKAGTLTLDHEAIKALNWPAMTMAFKVADPALLKTKSGTKVRFRLKGQTIVSLRPL